MSLLQKLTTERTENTEYKELMSKRVLEGFFATKYREFRSLFINFC